MSVYVYPHWINRLGHLLYTICLFPMLHLYYLITPLKFITGMEHVKLTNTGNQKYMIKVILQASKQKKILKKIESALKEKILYLKKQRNSVSFSTTTLSTMSAKMESCSCRILFETNDSLLQIKNWLRSKVHLINSVIHHISNLDVLNAFIVLSAKNRRFIKPTLRKADFTVFYLEDCENLMHYQCSKGGYDPPSMPRYFDVILNTGNMTEIVSGDDQGDIKCYLRQIAYVVILAHVGCFVPCESAVIPIFSKILSKLLVINSSNRLQSHLKCEVKRYLNSLLKLIASMK